MTGAQTMNKGRREISIMSDLKPVQVLRRVNSIKQSLLLGVSAATLLFGWPSIGLAELPASGVVSAGAGTISLNGNTLTINQSTDKMAIDWESFSVGSGKIVEFVQPSSAAAALNRVLGSDVSRIQGSLRANGKVFLLNPNGVLFTPTAQVNAGGLVSTTLGLSNSDFMSGRLTFEGDSANAIVNQGNIQVTSGGTVAMIAARIVNEPGASVTADGGEVLIGAGSKVTLDLGGPARIKVDRGVLQALIEQGGAVRADGGLVYMTAKSAEALGRNVINHTGVTRAQTAVTGNDGAIYLMGGMDVDSVRIDGTLDASAPQNGDGGFVETSAANVTVANDAVITTLAANGSTGNWLIDPVDYYVLPSGGNITGAQLGTNLNTTNVTIETVSGTGGAGDIFIRDNVTKTSGSATTLTLQAYRNIVVGHTNTGVGNGSPTVTLSGSSGSPLNLVFSARSSNATYGHVELVKANLLTYGGDVTIGGGDSTASGYAVTQEIITYNNLSGQPTDSGGAGVRIRDSIINASSDANQTSATYQDWLGTHTYLTVGSTSGSGGNIVIRGQGSGVTSGSANLGVWSYAGSSIATAGNGTITLDGTGGRGGLTYGRVGSAGVLLEGRGSLLAQSGNIVINGRAGNGYGAYGVGFTEGGGLIRTGGSLSINTADGTLTNNDNAVLIRDNQHGVMTFDVGSASAINAPLVGGTDNLGITSNYSFRTTGAGDLTLLGNASAWEATRPGTTPAMKTTGTYEVQGSGRLLLGAGLTIEQTLVSFWASVANQAQSNTLQYSIGATGGMRAQPPRLLTPSERIELILRGLPPPGITQEELAAARAEAVKREEARLEREARLREAMWRGDTFLLAKMGAPSWYLDRAEKTRKNLISRGRVPQGQLLPHEVAEIKRVKNERARQISLGVAVGYMSREESARLTQTRQKMIDGGIVPPNASKAQRALAEQNRRNMIARGVAPKNATVAERFTAARNTVANGLRTLFRR